jgi:hypothetical protein
MMYTHSFARNLVLEVELPVKDFTMHACANHGHRGQGPSKQFHCDVEVY